MQWMAKECLLLFISIITTSFLMCLFFLIFVFFSRVTMEPEYIRDLCVGPSGSILTDGFVFLPNKLQYNNPFRRHVQQIRRPLLTQSILGRRM